jgi:hypothetical protein
LSSREQGKTYGFAINQPSRGHNLLANLVLIFIIYKPAPATEDEMMIEITEYTERIVAIVRPRKVLYLAIGDYYT